MQVIQNIKKGILIATVLSSLLLSGVSNAYYYHYTHTRCWNGYCHRVNTNYWGGPYRHYNTVYYRNYYR
jgi:hypothetical protein